MVFCEFSRAGAHFGNGIDALLIATSRAGTAGSGRLRLRGCSHCVARHARRQFAVGVARRPIAHADASPRRRRHQRPTPRLINSTISAGATVTNLGSNFLERLGNQATNGFSRMLRTNPGGGGASESDRSAALPHLGRGLRDFGDERPARPISSATTARPVAASPGSARALRPASMSVSRSTRAAPPSTFRWRCSRRRST